MGLVDLILPTVLLGGVVLAVATLWAWRGTRARPSEEERASGESVGGTIPEVGPGTPAVVAPPGGTGKEGVSSASKQEPSGAGQPTADHPPMTSLDQKVNSLSSHLVLLRRRVSRQAWRKGRALLEALGLSAAQIAECYGMHPLNEEEAVQHGLQVWLEGGANTTWEALLEAMETAKIDVQQREGLKEELRSNAAQQVLNHFRSQFIDIVDANAIVHDLKHEGIIDGGDLTNITKTPVGREQNANLHDCLLQKCTEEALMKVCKIIVDRGHPRMKELGEQMLSKLDAVHPMSSWNCQALVSLREKLQQYVLIEAGLGDKLEKEAGGFMDELEAHTVREESGNIKQMNKVIDILLGKADKDFTTFLSMLQDSNNKVSAEELERRAEQLKEEELQLAYKKSLDKHGSVSVEVTPCVIVGASATGKSSLKHLLVHDAPKAVKTSTAVIDTPAVVTVSSEQYAVEEGTSGWQLVDDSDVMGKSIQECVTAKAYDKGQYPELPRSKAEQSHQKMKDEAAPLPFTSQQKRQNPMREFIKRVQHIFHASAEGTADSKIVALLDRGLSAFLHDVGAQVQSINLKNASFIHLLDTGGQPSFQDALPLLLDVPCTYIQVFNAAQDLDQPVPITYRRDDHTEESLPPSAETGWEMMLRSFSSMHTMANKSPRELPSFQQEEGQLPQLRIFVVGTFKDQLVEEGRLKEAVQDISRRLRELEGKPYYRCIQKDTAGQPCYLINNMAEKEDDRADVNSLHEHLSSTRSSLKLKVPVMWYICKQITQGTSHKFFRFQDLKAFCLKHKFIDANAADEQFRSLLKLLSLLGFYAFFNLKDVPDEANYVCTDKGVFMREVSKLLAVQFLQAPRCHSVEVFKRNGIMSNNAEMFEELGIIEEVDRSWFLAALEHVGLLARYASATDHSTSYFMPIALPQGKTKLPDHGSVASLCVTFTFHSPDNPLVYSDLPRGLFCRLAVELSKGSWEPVPQESDRTTVKFLSEKFDLYLTEAPGFIRLTPVLAVQLEGKEQLAVLHTLCSEMYGTLQKSILPSAVDVLGEQFHQTAKVTFGFECGCGNVPHLAIPVAATAKSLICQSTQKRHNSLKKEQIWFSPVENTELVKVAGCNTPQTQPDQGLDVLKFQEQYSEVVRNQASVTLKITKCTTIGPPRIGKTCFKNLLIGQEWDVEAGTASTDVMEAPEWVECYSLEEGGAEELWKLVSKEQQKGELIRAINKLTINSTQLTTPPSDMTPPMDAAATPSGTESRITHSPTSKRGAAQKPVSMEQQKGELTTPPSDAQNPTKLTDATATSSGTESRSTHTSAHPPTSKRDAAQKPATVWQALEALAGACSIENLQDFLKDKQGKVFGETRLVHFIDTGGQAIYHDVHPVLITSPSVYLVVFSLDDFQQKNDQGRLSYFRSDLIQRPLRSIHTFGRKNPEEKNLLQLQPEAPKIFIVGTHLDQIPLNGQEQFLERIDEMIEEEISSKPYHQFVQYDTEGRSFWAVDNTQAGKKQDEDTEKYISTLRLMVQDRSMEMSVQVPLPWMLLKMVMDGKGERYCKYSELLEEACSRGYVREGSPDADLDIMLRLFNALGLFYHKVPKGCKKEDSLVFIDPDCLYSATSDFLMAAKEEIEDSQRGSEEGQIQAATKDKKVTVSRDRPELPPRRKRQTAKEAVRSDSPELPPRMKRRTASEERQILAATKDGMADSQRRRDVEKSPYQIYTHLPKPSMDLAGGKQQMESGLAKTQKLRQIPAIQKTLGGVESRKVIQRVSSSFNAFLSDMHTVLSSLEHTVMNVGQDDTNIVLQNLKEIKKGVEEKNSLFDAANTLQSKYRILLREMVWKLIRKVDRGQEDKKTQLDSIRDFSCRMSRRSIAVNDFNHLLLLLTELRIIAGLKQPDCYLIPAALPQLRDQIPVAGDIEPLLFTVISQDDLLYYLPSGLFCCLISELVTKLGWTTEPLGRTHVAFTHEDLTGVVHVVEHESYIEIKLESTMQANVDCNSVREQIDERINNVYDMIYDPPESRRAVVASLESRRTVVGFKCNCGRGPAHAPHFAAYEEDKFESCVRCLLQGSTDVHMRPLTQQQLVWFPRPAVAGMQ